MATLPDTPGVRVSNIEKAWKIPDAEPDQEVMSARGLQLGPCGFLEQLGTQHPELPTTESKKDEGGQDEDGTDRGGGPGGPTPGPPPMDPSDAPGPSNWKGEKRQSQREQKKKGYRERKDEDGDGEEEEGGVREQPNSALLYRVPRDVWLARSQI